MNSADVPRAKARMRVSEVDWTTLDGCVGNPIQSHYQLLADGGHTWKSIVPQVESPS